MTVPERWSSSTARRGRGLWVAAALALLLLGPAGHAAGLSPGAVRAAAGAVTLAVQAPASATAGRAFTVRVTARDSAGAVAVGYRGRVTFASDDTKGPTLPAAYTFTAADAGTRVFTGVVLRGAGSRTVRVTDAAGLTGVSNRISVAAATATRLTVSAPRTVVAGDYFAVTLTVKDPWFNIVRAFRGTVEISSDDTREPILRGQYTFTAADAGVHRLTDMRLASSGPRILTFRGLGTGPLVGTSPPILVTPAFPARFVVAAPAAVASGEPFDLAVTVKDPFFNIVRGYRGTVTLTSTDRDTSGLPATYAFTAADNGVHVFTAVRLSRSGRTLIDLTTPDPELAASVAVQVSGGAPPTLTAFAWGQNRWGTLGDGTRTNRPTPAPVDAAPEWDSVSAGSAFAVGIRSDGTLWSWGLNTSGQLGVPGVSLATRPVEVSPDTDWASVAAGSNYALAVRTDGTLWAWGDNANGQLGLGVRDFTLRSSPVRVGTATDWASVSASLYSVATKTDGSVWGWGTNPSGAIGTPIGSDSFVPRRIGTGTAWSQAVATSDLTLLRRADGTLWVTGRDAGLRQVGTASDWVHVDGETWSYAGVRSDGSLWTWGDQRAGVLGDGTGSGPRREDPVPVVPGTQWRTVSVGHVHMVGIRVDGTLWGWGSNALGTVGDGTLVDRWAPVQVGTGTSWEAVSVSERFSVALAH